MATQKFLGANSLIKRLTAQVGSKDLALKLLEERGHVKPGTQELTPEGERRNAMTAAQRAVDRVSKASGKPASHYKYNPRTNRATLKVK